MDLPSEKDIASLKQFLDKFCEEINDFPKEDDNLPFRIFSYFMRVEDIEGECLGWAQQYLLSNECPATFLPHLARTVYTEIFKYDVTEFYADDDDTENQEEKDDDDDDNDENMKKKVDNDNDDKDYDDDDDDEENEDESTKTLKDVTFLDARKFIKEVLNTVHKVCRDWKTKLPPLHINSKPLEVCVHSVKNTRRKMEDVHVICSDLNTLFNLKDCASHSYYSVFDGHGGLDAAIYAGNHLHTNLVHNSSFLTDPCTALKQAYKQTDEGFLLKAKKENLKSGTTGVTVLKLEKKLYIAWLGDSQAVVVKNGETVTKTEPHKPEKPDEKERIEKLGGIVVWFGTWRVNGAIAVARAIGDRAHKPFICSDADVCSIDLDGTEDYIVLACDGVWDVVEPNDVPELVYNHIQQTKGDRTRTAHRIVEVAKESGSNDNISVIVVFLRDDISPPQGKMSIQFPTFAAKNPDKGDDSNDKTTNNKSGGKQCEKT
ncbi:hypothetical protein LOTGIDRAFT_174041 [Lottia gigantea]|uniref:Protein phosphatase 1E n=2 Tax=Lottia gigantea TaxID=225164 RepID=V4ANE2_LOTGI|nr:hypothetical protein LOTGIDRAFT_174041 [Lottia gigantea]ESO98677.1 hypothetical protein LOTGIDRAFT_174041 [Lottia gigantea]